MVVRSVFRSLRGISENNFFSSECLRRITRMEETGLLTVEKIDGKSTVTRCFSKYPLKLIIPKKGDRVVVGLSVGDGCTVALTTQASTKVYKSVDSKCSEQVLEVFRISSDSNLVIVDWITSGRHESGEKWDFEFYKSSNNILLDGGEPLFVDSVLLEQTSTTSVAERMKDYQVAAMVIILGPKLKHLQDLIQSEVEHMMSGYFRPTKLRKMSSESSADGPSRPPIFACCSSFGAKAGVVVRLLSTTTEAVYAFLRHHLSGLEQFLGAPPYRR